MLLIGKHIVIQAPAKSGFFFYNYKKLFSIALLTICNADYEFTLIYIGEAVAQSDRGVFSNSNLGYSIVNDLFDIPEPENVHDSDFTLPFVLAGDDAFPMKTNLVKPYSAFHLDLEKLITKITEYPEKGESQKVLLGFWQLCFIFFVVLFWLWWKLWNLLQKGCGALYIPT